jgi:S1-C subfamily serine protease
MTRRFTPFLLVSLLLAGFIAGSLLSGPIRNRTSAGAQTSGQSRPSITTPGPASAATTLTDFSRIAERTVPAVVNISAQQVVRRQFYDPLESLFGRPDVFSRRGVQNSLGSGVIVSADGFVLTNFHVVTGEANRRVTIEQVDVTVVLSDKRELRADLVGSDSATDLALLKIAATGLPTIQWGDSSRLRVGEWVLAIGNPYQLSETVTLGIVSAVGRTNLGVSRYEDFIQTDAAINPGNSGGALVNAEGRLVGINTFIYSQSGGYQGIGFAVSGNLAQRIVSDLQQYQEVRRGTIGLAPDDYGQVTTRLADELGVPDTRGVVVFQMYRDSSAYRSGMRPGDAIVAFNGTQVDGPGQLWRLMSDARIGSTASVTVIRDRRRIELKIPVVRLARS